MRGMVELPGEARCAAQDNLPRLLLWLGMLSGDLQFTPRGYCQQPHAQKRL